MKGKVLYEDDELQISILGFSPHGYKTVDHCWRGRPAKLFCNVCDEEVVVGERLEHLWNKHPETRLLWDIYRKKGGMGLLHKHIIKHYYRKEQMRLAE